MHRIWPYGRLQLNSAETNAVYAYMEQNTTALEVSLDFKSDLNYAKIDSVFIFISLFMDEML